MDAHSGELCVHTPPRFNDQAFNISTSVPQKRLMNGLFLKRHGTGSRPSQEIPEIFLRLCSRRKCTE